LDGTIKVDHELYKGKTVLLVDDLYQSGVSINYAAMLLLDAGAKKIFGLSCEKTCSNDDNVRWKGK
jgi:predicted amidophosphoribosyltransferase